MESFKDAFLKSVETQLSSNTAAVDTVVTEEIKTCADNAYVDVPVETPPNTKMFSELFFDPADVGKPDFPVRVFDAVAEDWPQWVTDSVPTPDPAYIWNKETVYNFVMSDYMHAMLVGMPASGKTSLPLQVAAVTGRPVFKQSFSNDLEADEWLQAKEINESGTFWNNLPFVNTLGYPFYAVLDEFNRLSRGGRLLMNRLLDDGGTMQLRDGGEITPHPEWRAVATDNTKGTGDGLDMFDGDVADVSTTDRFGVMLEVPYLSPQLQCELLKSQDYGISSDLIAGLVAFGSKCATAFEKREISLPFTTRRLKVIAGLAGKLKSLSSAIDIGYTSFLSDDAQVQVVDAYMRDLALQAKYG